MAFDQRGLDDYIDVAQRIADFRERYPEGSLAPFDPARPWELATVTGYDRDGQQITQAFIVYTAVATRQAGDMNPGIACAWEVFPGRTPYTRGSELMNAETSAWGRAIIAVGASDSRRGIASREEVRNRRAERDDGLPQNRDGSLSRSRTTDEEKAAAGVMTAAQQAEHNQMARDVHRGDGRVASRLTGADPDDPWLDAPPPDPVDADTPGTATRDQVYAIITGFSDLGIGGRKDRLGLCTTITGRDIESSNDLSRSEADQVLAELGERKEARSHAGQGAAGQAEPG